MTSRQPHPTVRHEDVERLARRTFAETTVDLREVMAIVGPSSQLTPRVAAAALMLCDGSIQRLHELVALAMTDERDVIAAAEYPRFMALVDPDEAQRAAAIAEDWSGYQGWFEDGNDAGS